MKYDALVVGAGFAGCTAARLLAESDLGVLVVERQKHVAGHCYDKIDANGILVHMFGPHIFHTTRRDVWRFVQRFSGFHNYQHRVLSYVHGRCLPFPINRDTLEEAFGVRLETSEVPAYLEREVENSQYSVPHRNFRDVVVSQVGERLYEMFYKNYTIKQWEKDPEELSPEIARRVPVRSSRDNRYFADPYQGIPLRGYTSLAESLLDHPNISVLLGADFFDVRDDYATDLVVYTGGMDRYFDYRHGRLEYRSLRFRWQTVDREQYQDVAVVNYPNDYEWTRVTEYKHFLPTQTSRTTVCFEFPEPEGEPFYVVLTDRNISNRERYGEEIKSLEETQKVLFIGRLAEYRYYNMDEVIAAATDKIGKWLGDRA